MKNYLLILLLFFSMLSASNTFIGVSLDELNEDKLKELQISNGVMIADVIAQSPAQKAGLLIGDIIISINKERIFAGKQITEMLSKSEENDRITINILRENSYYDYDIILEERRLPKIILIKCSHQLEFLLLH